MLGIYCMYVVFISFHCNPKHSFHIVRDRFYAVSFWVQYTREWKYGH